MPLYDYQCKACAAEFELLVRGGTTPACPQCGAIDPERRVSLTAPQGQSKAIIAAGRKAAARAGHLSNYSRAERGKAR
jgi:putative FmdB family regulatory protein